MPIDPLEQAEKALVALDADSLVSLYADEFLFEDTSTGDRIATKGDLKAYFERLFTMPNVSFSDVSFFSMGARGAGQWTWRGTSRQTGAAFAVRGASLFTLADDSIREEVIFYDPRPAYS